MEQRSRSGLFVEATVETRPSSSQNMLIAVLITNLPCVSRFMTRAVVGGDETRPDPPHTRAHTRTRLVYCTGCCK